MDFLNERNLWQIYLKSRVIPTSKINKWGTFAITLISFINGAFLSNQELYEVIKTTSGSLFGVLITTLGFLVAGYTIFCTVLPVDLQKQMMIAIDEDTNLSYLKKFHFLFLRVFFYFVVFSGFLFLVNFFQGSSGLIFHFIENPCFFFSLNLVGYTLISGFTVFLLFELMSFIFNIFESVRSALNWEKIKEKNKTP
ncbi:hypothetical protein [Acinetobacter sp. 18QD2AZ41W]|jgi:hypothetical protein|uniref:hypothetical protein n=1 Tax=Acinetobacter sp. 18QD2AZ41W TaxID=2692137 RepID=UPI0013587A7A|nr:hypothetical protein [Acinetobacter sp. 18QD2AZ41W]